MPISRDRIPTNTLVLSDVAIYELFLLRMDGLDGLSDKDYVAMKLPCPAPLGQISNMLLLYDADNGSIGWNPLNQHGLVSERYQYRFIRYLEPEEGITLRGSGVEPE